MELAGELADAVWIRGLDAEVVRLVPGTNKREAHTGRAATPLRLPSGFALNVMWRIRKKRPLPEVASYAASQAANLWSAVFCRERPDIMDLRQRVERKYPGLIDEMKRIHDAIDDSPAQRVSQKLVDFLHLTGPSEEICETVHAMQNTGVTGISAVMLCQDGPARHDSTNSKRNYAPLSIAVSSIKRRPGQNRHGRTRAEFKISPAK